MQLKPSVNSCQFVFSGSHVPPHGHGKASRSCYDLCCRTLRNQDDGGKQSFSLASGRGWRCEVLGTMWWHRTLFWFVNQSNFICTALFINTKSLSWWKRVVRRSEFVDDTTCSLKGQFCYFKIKLGRFLVFLIRVKCCIIKSREELIVQFNTIPFYLY